MENYYTIELQQDLRARQEKLQTKIKEQGADGCILNTNTNLFYMTGSVYSGYYYLPAEGDAWHFIKRPNGIDFLNTIYIRKPEQITEELKKHGIKIPGRILLETDSISLSEGQRLIAALGNPEILNASALLRYIRSIKTEYEISRIRECAKEHVEVYKLIPSLFKRGITDLELQAEIEREMRLHGSIGIFRAYGDKMDIFMGSILAGNNAETPSPFDFALGGKGLTPFLPIGVANQVIKEGQTFMVDLAGNYREWMTDISRVYSVGKTTELAYKAHQVSIEIHNEIIHITKAGTLCADIYNKALEIVKENDLENYFMGTKQQAKFVGHGVGLEINEPPVLTPRSKEILEENIVFALEPKFVIPDVGAVGIENTYLVRAKGLEKLTVLEENIIEL